MINKRLLMFLVLSSIVSGFIFYKVFSNAIKVLIMREQMYLKGYSQTKECNNQQVSSEKELFLRLPIKVTVTRSCPEKGGESYEAQIWDHFFWIGY